MNLLKDIASGAWQVLKTVAPVIADTAAGPYAPLVDPLIKKVFGTNNPKQVETALLSATPEQLLALKQADSEHAEKLAQIGIDRDKLAFEDTASARAMQIAVKDPNVARLAWTIVGGFIVISFAQLIAMIGFADEVNKIPPQGWLLIGNISGYLANEAKQVAAFYFGSTASSQAKDVTIADIAKQP